MFIDKTICPGFTIQVLSREFITKKSGRLNAIIALLADCLCQSNPIFSFLRIESDRLQQCYFRHVLEKAIEDELSLICIDNNQSDAIAAVLVNEDFYETLFPDRHFVQNLEKDIPEMRPVLALFKHLDQALVKKQFNDGIVEPKKVFHAAFLATSSEYRRRGLAHGLCAAAVTVAKMHYYDFICAKSTSTISHHIWIDKLGAFTQVSMPTNEFQLLDGTSPFSGGSFEPKSTIALLALQAAGGREDEQETVKDNPSKRIKLTETKLRPSPPIKQNPRQTAPNAGSWKAGLYFYLNNPSDRSVEHVDDAVMAITDKYPKARRHYLVMPRNTRYRSYQGLTADDVSLLEQLHLVAKQLMAKHPKLHFRIGIHAVPSMDHLHLHVVSQDFDSPCLKNKKHWNSFTTDFFVPYEELFECVRSNGDLAIFRERESHLKGDLKCHQCRQPQKNMPTLKQHISMCRGKQR